MARDVVGFEIHFQCRCDFCCMPCYVSECSLFRNKDGSSSCEKKICSVLDINLVITINGPVAYWFEPELMLN